MIREELITIVVQGDVRSNTKKLLLSIRKQVPHAKLIFSTFANQVAAADRDGIDRLVDRFCLTDDPGPMPATVNSPTAPPNNINRMLRSTQLGLSRVTTPYALKLRSDAECDVLAIVKGWTDALGVADPETSNRLAFASHYTRHPHGINGYTFHVSDWMTFGRTLTVSDYWSAPRFTEEDAVWFDSHPLPPDVTATSRRFRAVFSQEQWLCVHYAKRKGYFTPSSVHDRAPEVVFSYQRFLSRECVILDVDAIRMHVPKQAWARRSSFQDMDCVSHQDWLVMSGRAPVDTKRDQRRALARRYRHQIARAVLLKKWINARWASLTGRKAQVAEPMAAARPP